MQATLQLNVLLTLTGLSLFGCSSTDDTAATGGGDPGGMTTTTLLDRAEEQGLARFVAIAEASSYASVLDGTAQVTVLAPNDDALDALGAWPPGPAGAPLTDPVVADLIMSQCILDGALDLTALSGYSTLVTTGGGLLLVDEAAGGGSVSINSAEIIESDITADNGRLHIIDVVLTPRQSAMDTLRTRGYATFVEAIEVAGMEAEVDAAGQTVFAPLESSFDALTAAERAALLDPAGSAELADRVRFHMLPSALSGSDLRLANVRETSTDALAFFTGLAGGGIAVNGRAVVRTNEVTTGGFVHAVEEFVPNPKTLELTIEELGLSTFDGLVSAASLQPEFDAPSPLTLFAPSNTAFESLPAGRLDMLVDPTNAAVLRNVLLNHGTALYVPESSLTPGFEWVTLASETVLVQAPVGDSPVIGAVGAMLEANDVFFRQGVVHVVDQVLDLP